MLVCGRLRGCMLVRRMLCVCMWRVCRCMLEIGYGSVGVLVVICRSEWAWLYMCLYACAGFITDKIIKKFVLT